ncbi:Extracellular exo-alpha-(1-_5)-L-arabinofuranosidase [Orchesella cincta]|uniref:Extracellular exo-alpha-(1->5)-L-arabinofuranosidase n=1 Tax=Orchesella cincta TaxID=48709 RepID=A0A1D2M2X9_ORCCI|nr:Extracellular exo-alpha-(1->5)-L-arabinofuranosidase [Orchesella cincta]
MDPSRNFLRFLFICIALACSSSAQETFTNPIVDGNSADPFVGRVGDFYYMILSTDTEHELTIYKSSEMTNFRNVESKVIFRAPEGYQNVWASEMHRMMDGNLYIYFAMGPVGDFNRNWAIKADDPNDPMGSWSEAMRLLPHLEQPGVDGTILKHNSKWYYVWSGRDGIEGSLPHDSILITEMLDPVNTTTQTTVIRQPLLPWERNVNEGPFFIYNNNVSYLLFAASFTFSEYYCLGLMSIDEGLDPMNASNWWYGPEDGPVFYKNEEEDVWGPGHASFTVSPDGTETWAIYHASDDKDRIEHYRVARADKVEWGSDGRPVFPRPHGYYSPQPIPSGQTTITSKTTFTNPIISGDSPDPHVLLLNGIYYLPLTTDSGSSITIFSSSQLTNFRNVVSKKVHEPTDCISDIWAPELTVIKDELFMFLSLTNCTDNAHNVYVMKAENASDPLGVWDTPYRLLPEVTAQTADGAVLQRNGELYYVYESREDPYGLWIARMFNARKVDDTSRTLLKAPTESWEAGVTNGPAFLQRGNVTFMTYSAGNPGGADYSIGLMSIPDSLDPLVASNWNVKSDGPVFYRNDEDMVFATGHAGFTTSPDGSEVWMTYHAAEWPDRVFGNRVARAEKIEWDQEGNPIFPRPHGYFSPQPLPKGQI